MGGSTDPDPEMVVRCGSVEQAMTPTDLQPQNRSETDIAAIRAQLLRIMSSEPFAKSDRRRRFLKYIVEEALAGRGDQIKGYAIGVEVFDRPPSFDPAIDPIVRVEAGRLRDRLQEYYREQGRSDPITILLPKGAYAPDFVQRSSETAATGADEPLHTKAPDARFAQAAGTRSLAVLPFVNISGESEQQYFADGLTDNLITDLSKVSGLMIISRHSSFAYRDVQKTAGEIAFQLGVRYVVEGSVRRSRDRVRISASLVDTASDRCQWAERYDRDLTDIFAVQDEVSRHVVEALEVKLTPFENDRLGHEGTHSIQAHDVLLRGLERFWNYTRESCADAVTHFTRAVELDHRYAAAHAWLARAHVFQYSMTWVPEFEKSLLPALEHARLAVELDDLLPLAHAVLGWACLWNRDGRGAMNAGRRACGLDPNNADAHLFLSMTLSHTGHAEDGLRYIEKGMRLNPRPTSFYFYAQGNCCLALKRYAEAIEALRRGIEVNPMFMPNHGTLAVAYALTGQIEAARKEAEILRKIWPTRPYRPILDAEFSERYEAARRLAGLDSLWPPEISASGAGESDGS